MSYYRRVMAGACLVVLGVAACSPEEVQGGGGSADEFKVGVVTSLSGELAFGGNITKRGYDYWADTVNDRGGIEVGGGKYPVRLIFADDQSDPAQAAEAVERLIVEEEVDFILGPYSSSATLGAAPIIEKYKVPHITGSAESPDIWEEGFKYTFGTIPAANVMAPHAIQTLSQAAPQAKTVYVVGIDDPFAKAVAESFRSTAEKEGMKVLDYTLVPPDADLSPVISKAKAAGPDVFAFGGHPENHIEMVKVASELGFNPDAIVIHWGVETSDFLDGAGDQANYVWGATPWLPLVKHEDPLWGDVERAVEGFAERYDHEPDYTEAASAATGVVYMEALRQIDSDGPPLDQDEKDALVQALEDIEVETFFGPVDFEESGEFMHDNTLAEVLTLQIQNGKPVVVGPEDQAKGNPKFPMPPWGQR
jgi:branched-chain amino acid transport system substrate-binding protein